MCVAEPGSVLDESDQPRFRKTAPELELVVVHRLGERLPAGHDDRTLAVRERDDHRADTRMGHDHPCCADCLDHPFEGQEVDELGVRVLDADGMPVLDQQLLLERELGDCA